MDVQYAHYSMLLDAMEGLSGVYYATSGVDDTISGVYHTISDSYYTVSGNRHTIYYEFLGNLQFTTISWEQISGVDVRLAHYSVLLDAMKGLFSVYTISGSY